ncbi:HAD-IC family P-type ATPase [Oceanicaulis alexandrii]|uniref:cation-translocating P-type ATPase n=1 Tax=Oceanicaulis alexandrii TaxID=153233 RepID=UPI0035CF6928
MTWLQTDPSHCSSESPDQVVRRFGGDASDGLEEAEARKRLAEGGGNVIDVQERFSPLRALLHQLIDPLVILLAVASGLAALLGEVLDAVMISIVVALNVGLSFFQEWRAERALAAIAGLMTPHSTVIRSGRRQQISALELAPGDLVEIRRGDRTPADLKLITAEALLMDESPLTGESRGVRKAPGADPEGAPVHDRASMAFAGALVLDGHATGLVVATGVRTEFGRIAALAGSVQRLATPLQRRLGRLSAKLGGLAILAALGIMLIGVATGRPLLEMVFTGVSLAVAAVPEGLPAVVALTLALGVRAMARRNALVRRLRAAETLGSATVICTDKTGTLTTGEMTVVETLTAQGRWEVGGGEPDTLAHATLYSAGVCNNAELCPDGAVKGEPTERALMLAALEHTTLDGGAPPDRLAEQPFSAERKRMSVQVRDGDAAMIHLKGAPDFVLPLCAHLATQTGAVKMDEAARRDWTEQAEAMGRRGLRVLAIARKAHSDADLIEHDLTFQGLVGLMDPPRPRAGAALDAARSAGLQVIMITGDAAGTAEAIAQAVGFAPGRVLSGAEIDALDEDGLGQALKTANVLSRTTPEHKLRVVRHLQTAGEVVAMTGDGVNDAPALKQADIGVAMGIRGSDAAKAAADLVLLDDDFSTIVDAVREGRRQEAAIRNFTCFLLATNLGEVLAVGLNIASSAPLILTPLQILWVNLLTDGPIALVLGAERAAPDLMSRPPRRPGAPVVDRTALGVIAAFGAASAAAALAAFQASMVLSSEAANAAAFSAVVILSACIVFSFRSQTLPLARLGWRGNVWLPVAALAAVATQLALVFAPPLQALMDLAPPSALSWQIIAGSAIALLIIPEAIKYLLQARRRR